MKRIVIFSFVFTVYFFSSCSNQSSWQITSPDGNISLIVENVDISGIKYLRYHVKIKDKRGEYIALESSKLGIKREDQDFTRDLRINNVSKINETDHTYRLISGKRLKNKVKGNEQLLSFANISGSFLNIRFRVYNDGVAFRYEFPEKDEAMHEIVKENSTFNIPDNGKAWMQPYDTLKKGAPAYEKGYLNDVNIGDEAPMLTGWAFPALFFTNKCWILLTETDVDTSYCGSHLAADSFGGEYQIEFPHAWESYHMHNVHPRSDLPWKTPWRVAIIGTELGDIVESNLSMSLASPNRLEYLEWIEPGVSSWSWWSDHTSSKSFDTLRKYIDFSTRMGWPYTLVDAGWHNMEGGSLEELVKYAETKNIGLWIWYNSGGPHNKVMSAGPRDLMHIPTIRKNEFERISDLGVAGIKVDFFHSDKQEIIKLYHDILQDAAYYDLMVNLHGCTLPRGWFRTYPNLLSMEAVKGAEMYAREGFSNEALWLNSIYPYTRNAIGSMDYTPVTFSDYENQEKHLTSNAHELALSIIFESGIQHIADNYSSVENQPEFVIDFLKNIPAAWDDIYFIDGFPGRLTVLAREKDGEYYIAGINSELIRKDIGFIPDFLPEGKYSFNIIEDGDTSRSFDQRSIIIDHKTEFKMTIPPGGGFVGVAQKQ